MLMASEQMKMKQIPKTIYCHLRSCIVFVVINNRQMFKVIDFYFFSKHKNFQIILRRSKKA